MDFEWDEAKNQANQLKHGISLERAVLIFAGRTRTITDDRLTMEKSAKSASA